LRLAPAVRDGAEARTPRPRAARRPGRRGARRGCMGAGARPAGDPGAELPRLVGGPGARRVRTGRPGRRVRRRPAGRRRERPRTRDMTAARDTVMRRIRDALGPAPAAPEAVPREYQQADDPVDFDAVERFAE